ncbi:hypothetical protein LCGC14_1586920 [marine sediment metagenome]|uniref:Uncharacterized protein n=1 Tax=marine sediment metagenome TaxID=412755 RepID=A0A0F9J1A7_9ZZZZ
MNYYWSNEMETYTSQTAICFAHRINMKDMCRLAENPKKNNMPMSDNEPYIPICEIRPEDWE